ncbi:TIGR02281 family clan AA aspartic protease [Pelagovum pacificum]|uniref:TIGR02281 family clan AA aspartic protease n=1 Tax=Pelagovum pacificum TaxID=2588711 RepID=A0A5C5GHL0_9RHOB|nr:TIGR02281 family clan AA aspartic protease [Pelagovum pacificum]QQA41384.1 TIGR02281 family clan AA aspartic protease [Pelagovum pacificum]TNY34265.1 TIGR02281 family clan AA aspartic protease [Pelagovum pacificum]
MDGDDIARIAYLSLLGAAIGGWFLMQNRGQLGKMAQQAAVWALIFVGVVAAVGLWSDIRDDVMPRQSVISENVIEIPRGPDGHYSIRAEVNGVPLDFVVDTGASQIVLSRQDAERVGIDPDGLVYSGSAQTANGIVGTAPVSLDRLAVGPIEDRNVRAYVNEGELFGSLLGMGYLNRFERIEIEGDRLILTR